MTQKKVTLELIGIDGNAYSIMGAFQRQARKENWTPEEINEVLTEAKSGDYDHLFQTIIAHTKSPDTDNFDDIEIK